MRIKLVLLLVLTGCPGRLETGTQLELGKILGEEVKCLQVASDEGFLCKGVSGRNYYCPRAFDKACSFTSRMQLLDIPAEKSKQ